MLHMTHVHGFDEHRPIRVTAQVGLMYNASQRYSSFTGQDYHSMHGDHFRLASTNNCFTYTRVIPAAHFYSSRHRPQQSITVNANLVSEQAATVGIYGIRKIVSFTRAFIKSRKEGSGGVAKDASDAAKDVADNAEEEAEAGVREVFPYFTASKCMYASCVIHVFVRLNYRCRTASPQYREIFWWISPIENQYSAW